MFLNVSLLFDTGMFSFSKSTWNWFEDSPHEYVFIAKTGFNLPKTMQHLLAWDNVSFHPTVLVSNLFNIHYHMRSFYLYIKGPHMWMDDAHGDIGADTCQDWVCPSRPFPRCSAMGNITCELWCRWGPPARSRFEAWCCVSFIYLCLSRPTNNNDLDQWIVIWFTFQ